MFTVTPKENLEQDFSLFANELMLKRKLSTQKNQYYFAEVEFYLYHDQHPDSSTHCCKRQKEKALWYLHRYKNCDRIKAGRRKGLDITFGDEGKNIYAGILIRALQNINDEDDYVYGPSKVVDRILNDNECDIADLEIDNIYNNKYLRIENGTIMNMDVIPCPRFNLGNNTPEDYREPAYRFITFPLKKHGGKETLIFPYLKQKMENDKILSLFNRRTI